jgi:hypothetical protein
MIIILRAKYVYITGHRCQFHKQCTCVSYGRYKISQRLDCNSHCMQWVYGVAYFAKAVSYARNIFIKSTARMAKTYFERTFLSRYIINFLHLFMQIILMKWCRRPAACTIKLFTVVIYRPS